MKEQLAPVLITPYSLLKSRTGGVIGRILSLSRNLRFVGARMYAPSDAMVDKYLATLAAEDLPETIRKALAGYVDGNLRRQNPFNISNRMMMLLFQGPDAVRVMYEEIVGKLTLGLHGDTVRGTYGDFVAANDRIAFFEPAALTPSCQEANRAQLAVLREFAESDGGILTNVLRFPDPERVETTLVIIKPDNFARLSSRPGNIIDVFSRTGLYIVGARLLRLSQEQAEEFYGPLRQVFRDKLRGQVVARSSQALRGAFNFPLSERVMAIVAEALVEPNAEFEFQKIANYMTGRDEAGAQLPADDRGKCLALLYQGEDAVAKIRRRLGATNPQEAEEGTVRSIYGYDLMKNGAHASDSAENAARERRIIGLWQEKGACEEERLIAEYLKKS